MIQKGDRLKSNFTGQVYTVRSIGEGVVSAIGPHGPVAADKEEIEQDIEDGKIEVLN